MIFVFSGRRKRGKGALPLHLRPVGLGCFLRQKKGQGRLSRLERAKVKAFGSFLGGAFGGPFALFFGKGAQKPITLEFSSGNSRVMGFWASFSRIHKGLARGQALDSWNSKLGL